MRKTWQLNWQLRSKIQIKWEILSTFVAFSEYMNFIKNKVKNISFTVWLQCFLFDFLGHWQYSPDVRSNGESDFAHWTDDRTGLWHPCQEQRTLHHITSGFDVFQARFSDIYLSLILVDLNLIVWVSLEVRWGFTGSILEVWWGVLSWEFAESLLRVQIGFAGGWISAITCWMDDFWFKSWSYHNYFSYSNVFIFMSKLLMTHQGLILSVGKL